MNYKVFLTSSDKAKRQKKISTPCIIAIEPEDFTKEEVKKLKDKGYTVLGYLNVGSVENYRSYYKDLQKYALSRLEDWPDEYYLDLRRTAVRDWCIKRAKAIKAQGCDGWWIDNLDVYEEYKSVAMFNAVESILRRIKGIGGYVMINGGSLFLQDKFDKESKLGVYKVQCGAFKGYDSAENFSRSLRQNNIKTVIKMEDTTGKMLYKVQTGAFSVFSNAYSQMCGIRGLNFSAFIKLEGGDAEELPANKYIDGVTQEEVFTLIKDYGGKGKFGSQESKQSHWYREHMSRVKTHGMDTFLLEYSSSPEMVKKIKDHVKKYDLTGYYVSSDVDL